MSKPSILLVPGSFSLPELYDGIINAVAAKGYEIRGLHLPSVGLKSGPRDGAPPTMYDDAIFIAKEIEKLADEGKDIMLIAHSYGGIPASESTKGLSKSERQAQGRKGGVVRIAYMTAAVPEIGGTIVEAIIDVLEENQIQLKMDENGWMYHDPISVSARVCYNDIPPAEGQAFVKTWPKHSATSFGGVLTHAGYKDVPVSFLVCERDLCIPPSAQRHGIEVIEKASGRKVDVTSIDAGHVPIVAKEQEVIDWVLTAAATT